MRREANGWVVAWSPRKVGETFQKLISVPRSAQAVGAKKEAKTMNSLLTDTVWAMEPQAMQRMTQLMQQLPEHLSASSEGAAPQARRGELTQRQRGSAIIPIMGPMVKRGGFIADLFGMASMESIQQAVEEAAADESVDEIILQLDTPGGSVSGLPELADAVFTARSQKRVIAQVDGAAMSAGYFVASQADEIRMGRGDMVGSIGTILMLFDLSQAFESAGIEAVPISTGEFKHAGALGTEITEEQRADFQRIVDRHMSLFTDAVVRGRGMSDSQVNELADGRIFVGSEATGNGLADKIQTLSETLRERQPRERSNRIATSRAKLRLANI